MEALSFQIVLIALFAIASQWIAWKLRIPSIIFLLGSGFLLGPVLGLLNPHELMGDFLKPAIAAAVAIILFEGSLQLDFKELRGTQRIVRRITMFGAPIGWLLISIAAHYIIGLDWPTAITLGGILIVTGPTVIMPMLKQARLNKRIGSVLKWEGIVNDPLGVIFAILAYEYFVSTSEGVSGLSFFAENGLSVLMVTLVSFGFAHLTKRIFERGHMPEYLKAPFLVSSVLILFFSCNALLYESGLIAVTVMGITLTNIHSRSIEDIKRFKETTTLLLVSGLFLLLTADLELEALLSLNWQSFVFIFMLLFVIRPITVFISTLGTNITFAESVFTSLIAPRGIVCAAMAGIIGPLLVKSGFESGAQIFPIAFAIVVISVTLHSFMIKPLAEKLKLTSEEQNGVIIAGSYTWSVQLAEALKLRGVPVLIVDNNWGSLSKAKLAEIPVYHGELLSEETEFSLDFTAYNTLIAATANPAYNALLCENLGYEFGSERVFSVAPAEDEKAEHRKISHHVQGQAFVREGLTLESLHKDYDSGYRFKISRVGKKDDELIIPEDSFTNIHAGIIGKSGVVSFYTEDPTSQIAPREDDFIITLTKVEEESSGNT
jgi:NhaP-type Na+/H+ or K+/H+ antiporter/Trk K+ transport system NAD-binding subunit|tara:strand:- start:433652 stop:435463 length:1812 start_codon:yes stop_codon:yes gene_type:complete